MIFIYLPIVLVPLIHIIKIIILLQNKLAEQELDSVSVAAFKMQNSKSNLALRDEIAGLKNKNKALSSLVALIPILKHKLKEAIPLNSLFFNML